MSAGSSRRRCPKFEAGLLAAGLSVPPPPDLGTVSFDSNPSVGEVAFAVLRRHFAAVLAHETGTRLGEDAEELHDMRVATRRTRAALSLFEEALPVRSRHVRMELGWLAGALGAVRDLDVQLERVEGWILDVPEEEGTALADLATLLGRQRDDARRALLTCLDSARYERLVAGFITMLRQGPSRRSAAARAPAAAVVPGLIDARHRSATKAARRARRSGDPADFHLTRIRLKRLRYALEFVSEIYDRRTGEVPTPRGEAPRRTGADAGRPGGRGPSPRAGHRRGLDPVDHDGLRHGERDRALPERVGATRPQGPRPPPRAGWIGVAQAHRASMERRRLELGAAVPLARPPLAASAVAPDRPSRPPDRVELARRRPRGTSRLEAPPPASRSRARVLPPAGPSTENPESSWTAPVPAASRAPGHGTGGAVAGSAP